MSGKPASTDSTADGNLSAPLPILFFDASCLLCQRSIRWIIRRDPDGIFSYAGLDSQTAAEHIPADHPLRQQDTVILLDEEGLHGRSEAVFRVLRRIRTAGKVLLVFSIFPRSWTDRVYRCIAARRHRWFGRDETCALPDPDSVDRFLE